jgi:hypothetical protein
LAYRAGKEEKEMKPILVIGGILAWVIKVGMTVAAAIAANGMKF